MGSEMCIRDSHNSPDSMLAACLQDPGPGRWIVRIARGCLCRRLAHSQLCSREDKLSNSLQGRTRLHEQRPSHPRVPSPIRSRSRLARTTRTRRARSRRSADLRLRLWILRAASRCAGACVRDPWTNELPWTSGPVAQRLQLREGEARSVFALFRLQAVVFSDEARPRS